MSSKRLPKLTHLQFLVLGALASGPSPGRVLRSHLHEWRVRKSGPAFYQLMSRMEEAHLVEGWYEQRSVQGKVVRERHYRLSASGRAAWHASRRFYLQATDDGIGQPGLAYV